MSVEENLSQQQSGIALVNGVVLLGLYRAEKILDDRCQWITVGGKTKQVPRIFEQLGARLVAHRQDGAQFLRTRRTSLFVSPRRIKQMERAHRAEFKFLSIAVVNPHAHKVCGKDWLSLNKSERLQVCASITQNGVCLASDVDLPAQLLTTAPLLPEPKPAVIPAPKPQPKPDGLGMQWARVVGGILGILALIVLPFALLRGLEVVFGGAVAAITAYAVLAACVWTNKNERATGGSDVAF
jgi:hypothetical protein